ncbi:MAG: Mbov_0396 family ICE element transmembrane protein [Monoglobales bacterium]
MEIVYMGLLSKIFNAIFDAILSPVFKFLSSLLETVLGWLFRAVLQPLLQNVLWPIFKGIVDLVFEIFAGVIYGIFASILELIDAMQTIFNIFSGVQLVGFSGQEQYPMLELIFRLEPIQRAVLIVTIISFVLMMMFSAVAMARSMLELDVDHLRPVSRVLSSTMKAMIRFALIPISCMFLIMMSSQLLVGIGRVFETSQTSLGRMVFVVASLDASNQAEYNISGKVKDSDKPVKPSKYIGANRNDPVRWDYYTGKKDYANMDTVKEDFNFARFDYLIGFIASVFLIVVLAISLLSFVCRIFDVMLLFVASPFFVSTMPLDDGERFRSWTKMFVGKLFSGYGTVLGMNLYMMLCPSVMAGNLSFGSSKSAEADYLIRLIFIAGGAWAVIKSGPTITQILSEEAAGSEREASRTATGFVTATAVGAAHLAGDVWAAGKQRYQAFHAQRQVQDSTRQERIRKNLAKSGGFGGSGSGESIGGLGSSGSGGSIGGLGGSRSGGSIGGPGGSGSGGSIGGLGGSRSSGSGGSGGSIGGLGGSGSGGSIGGLGDSGSTDAAGRESALGSSSSDSSGEASGAFTGENRPSGENGSSGENASSEEAGSSRESSSSREGGLSSESSEEASGAFTRENRPSGENGASEEAGSSRESSSSREGGSSSESSEEASGAFTGENRPSGENGSSAENGSSGENASSEEGGSSRESGSSVEGSSSEGEDTQEESKKSSVEFIGGGRHFQIYRNEEGKKRLSVDFGKLFSISRGRDGSQRITMLGFGRKIDANGNTKVYTPVMNLKKTSGSASDGKFHLSKLNLGVMQMKRTMGPDGGKGDMYLKDLMGGMVRKRYDKETGKVETLSSFGTHYAKDSSGRYVMTDRNFLFFHEEYKQDKSGKYHVSHCSFLKGDEQSYHVNRETGERSLKNWTTGSGRNLYTSEASRVKTEKKQAAETKYNEMKQAKRKDKIRSLMDEDNT